MCECMRVCVHVCVLVLVIPTVFIFFHLHMLLEFFVAHFFNLLPFVRL